MGVQRRVSSKLVTSSSPLWSWLRGKRPGSSALGREGYSRGPSEVTWQEGLFVQVGIASGIQWCGSWGPLSHRENGYWEEAGGVGITPTL